MSQVTSSYRQLHEEFVVTRTGGPLWQCLLWFCTYPLLTFYACYVHSVLKNNSGFLRFILEFIILVIPLVIWLTFFHNYLHFFALCLLLGIIICLMVSLWKKKRKLVEIVFTMVTPVKERAYITYFRGMVNLISVFCILAVDFTIFPRELAKTESYGFSLMDNGVGFFIISNGIVAKNDTREGVIKTIKKTLPIIALGIFKCVFVKNMDYQLVVSEYGTHWNFFFTLAAVKLMATFLMNVFVNKELQISVFVAILHHFILQMGFEAWIVSNPPRTNPFSANREGICSLLGFLSLFLCSVAIGKSLQKDKVDLERDVKKASMGFLISFVLYAALLPLHNYYPVSRRFANVSYIIWMLAMSYLFLSICIIIEICLKVIYFVNSTNETLCPTILNAINYNGLSFFLLGNIFTGAINIWIKTMYVENFNSIIILTVYMFLLCFIINIFYRNRIKLSL